MLDSDASVHLQAHPEHSLALHRIDVAVLKLDTASEVEHGFQPEK